MTHYDQLFNLDGMSALVAGGGGYLGEVICEALATCGASVAVADVRQDAAANVSDKLKAKGHSAISIALDIADREAIRSGVVAMESKLGPVDVLVNCSYFSTGKTLETLSLEDWQACMRVSLSGAALLSVGVAQSMLDRGRGSIVHFSSMYGMVSPNPSLYGENSAPNPPDYGVAKAGILQLTRYQSVMWAPRGVRVNAIVPGPFPNPKGVHGNQEFQRRLIQHVPMKRIGRAEEITGPVVFLASDAASYVTGTSLVVDGGWTAW